jgi:putative hemolysin
MASVEWENFKGIEGDKGMKKILLAAGLLVVVGAWLLAGCGAQAPEPTSEPAVGLPNPASVHCEDEGGRLELRTDASGGQYGVCVFEDGSECEEWAFFRDECQPGQFDRAPEPGSD